MQGCAHCSPSNPVTANAVESVLLGHLWLGGISSGRLHKRAEAWQWDVKHPQGLHRKAVWLPPQFPGASCSHHVQLAHIPLRHQLYLLQVIIRLLTSPAVPPSPSGCTYEVHPVHLHDSAMFGTIKII